MYQALVHMLEIFTHNSQVFHISRSLLWFCECFISVLSVKYLLVFWTNEFPIFLEELIAWTDIINHFLQVIFAVYWLFLVVCYFGGYVHNLVLLKERKQTPDTISSTLRVTISEACIKSYLFIGRCFIFKSLKCQIILWRTIMLGRWISFYSTLIFHLHLPLFLRMLPVEHWAIKGKTEDVSFDLQKLQHIHGMDIRGFKELIYTSN